jgi:hypothetical protein
MIGRLLIDAAFETVFVAAGLEQGELPGIDVVTRSALGAADVGPGDAAVISTPEVTHLIDTHVADDRFAISTEGAGAMAMRSPRRPDEIDDAVVLLYDVAPATEALARATLWPFYGIKTEQWTTSLDAGHSITIVDGLRSLEPVEVGYSEDLARAWYILTEQPVVTHLLVLPREVSGESQRQMSQLLLDAATAGYERRREIRAAMAEEAAIDRDRLVDLQRRLRYEADDRVRAAAYLLIARGLGGTGFPVIRAVPWRAVES